MWTIEGKPNMSLLDAGYSSMGIDEGWEGCGQGVNKTQHDAKGDPVINKARFPDMAGMVKYTHDKGLKIGWYENGCACGERQGLMQNYEGDVRQLNALGFDSVKLDGCGAQRNMTLYADLMQKTGKGFEIENCHWGRCNSGDDSSCPTADWCPFTSFRTSGDINAGQTSWLKNLQTTIAFQDPIKPLSRPGCWAYPDMLEVGRVKIGGKMNFGWNRAHFGAWCVISAPLILGMDLTKQDTLAAVIDIVTNAEAIAVNQNWAGHPGGLIWSGTGGALGFPAARTCNPANAALKQTGWKLTTLPSSASLTGVPLVLLNAPGGGCLKVEGAGYPGGLGGLLVDTCNTTDPAMQFTYNTSTFHLTAPTSNHCVDVHSGGPIVWMYSCGSGPNNQLYFNKDTTLSVKVGAGLCVGLEQADPAGGTLNVALQAWAKPLNGTSGGVALLLINPVATPKVFEVPAWTLPLTGDGTNLTSKAISVRDIWARKNLAPFVKGAATIKMTVPGYDSAFLRLN
jgi:hypothetical protein